MTHTPNPITQHRKPNSQSGNVFLFILLGIALFAGLSYTVSRSMQNQSVTQMTEREAKLAAVDILDYVQKVERAISRIRYRGVSENDISFTNAYVSGYAHGSAQPAANQVFNTQGGAAAWRTPEQGANDGSAWVFTGATCIAGIGTGATGCDTDDESNEELIMALPNIDQSVCKELDKALNISAIPAETGGGYSTTKYTGSFADDTEIILPSSYKSACYSKGGNYHFYHVLIAR